MPVQSAPSSRTEGCGGQQCHPEALPAAAMCVAAGLLQHLLGTAARCSTTAGMRAACWGAGSSLLRQRGHSQERQREFILGSLAMKSAPVSHGHSRQHSRERAEQSCTHHGLQWWSLERVNQKIRTLKTSLMCSSV